MSELIKRYFVANKAPIISVQRLNLLPIKFVRCRGGNFDGFYWGRWKVFWRRPFSKEWVFARGGWWPADMVEERRP